METPTKESSTPVGDMIHATINDKHYENDVVYWKKRCELAESLIKSTQEVMGFKMSTVDIIAHEKWMQMQTIAYTF